MPKQSLEISDFSGGLDAISDPRDIKDNQFSKNWNVIVDRNGVLRLAGRGQHEIPASIFSSENFQEGFGLFQFSVDYSMNEIAGDLSSGSESGTIDTYTNTTTLILEDTASVSSSDEYYIGYSIYISEGTGVGQSRLITGYVGSSRTVTCTAFSTTGLHDKTDPTPSKYIIYSWTFSGNWAGTANLKDYISDGGPSLAYGGFATLLTSSQESALPFNSTSDSIDFVDGSNYIGTNMFTAVLIDEANYTSFVHLSGKGKLSNTTASGINYPAHAYLAITTVIGTEYIASIDVITGDSSNVDISLSSNIVWNIDSENLDNDTSINNTVTFTATGTTSYFHIRNVSSTNSVFSYVDNLIITPVNINLNKSKYSQKYFATQNTASITTEQSVNMGVMENKSSLSLSAGVEYNISFDIGFSQILHNYVSQGSKNGTGVMYGDRAPWIELYSTSVTDGTNTGLSLYANNSWLSGSKQSNYLSLTDSNFIENGDFKTALAGVEHISATNDKTFAGASNWANAAGANAFNAYDEETSGQLTVTPDDVSDVQYAYLDGANWEDVASGITAMVEGQTYQLKYDMHISAYTKGTLRVGMSNDDAPAIMQDSNHYVAVNGAAITYTLNFTYSPTIHEMITIYADANTVLTADFDNFSIKEVNWVEHDMTGCISVAVEADAESYGDQGGTLTLTSTTDFDTVNGSPLSYLYQDLSLDSNTDYHFNFIYGSTAISQYSIVDLNNLDATGVLINESVVTITGDGKTAGHSLNREVDGGKTVGELQGLLINKNIYTINGEFIGICTAVVDVDTITFGGGVALNLADNTELYIEQATICWTTLQETGAAITNYRYLGEDSNKKTTKYRTFSTFSNSTKKRNIQIRFAPASPGVATHMNIAGVTVHKAFNDLATMSSDISGNPFIGSAGTNKYSMKFKIPMLYKNGGDKSDWILKIHAGDYGVRTSAISPYSILTISADYLVYVNQIRLSSNASGEIITALNNNTENDSQIGLFSNISEAWDLSTLVWDGIASRPVYNYINGILKISDANFENDNSNIFYYYNKKSSEWIKADDSINTAPYTQLNNVPQNPLLPNAFDACAYLNLLHSTDHFISRKGTWTAGGNYATNWNQDEFGMPDGTGAPYGNGHIVRYLNDSSQSINELKIHPFARYLANPDDTDNHSSNIGFQNVSGSSNLITNQEGQNPLVARIVGTDTVNTGNDMSDFTAGNYVAKVKYSILWEVAASDSYRNGGHVFHVCYVPSFKIECGLGSQHTVPFVVNQQVTSGQPGYTDYGARTHQQMVALNVAPFAGIVGTEGGDIFKSKWHGRQANQNGTQIQHVRNGTANWDNCTIVSIDTNVGANLNQAQMTVLIEGEIEFLDGKIEDGDDIVFKIYEMNENTAAAGGYLLGISDGDQPSSYSSNWSCFGYGVSDFGSGSSTTSTYGNWDLLVDWEKGARFSRFMVQQLNVHFYNPDYDEDTDIAVLDGNSCALNIIWNSPSGSSSSSWSERSFKLGTTSVNYFNEESSINVSGDTIAPVSPGYAPEVCVQISKDRIDKVSVKKTKFYFKDNESDIWYLQFYVDHEELKFYSTTSGKSTTINNTNNIYIGTLNREDLKDFNEVNSYESETMVSQDDGNSLAKLTARYKTSVVANNRLYVGNIMQNGKVMGDRLLKSPIGKYNLLPASNFIDVATNDGDEITALSFYKDKLLQFKKRKVFVINTSDDYEFLEDTFQDIGVKGQCSVVTTPNGVAWANKTGCYLYDGEELTNLIEGIIPNSNDYASETHNTWNPGQSATNDSKYVIGYIEDRDSILVNFSDKKLSVVNYPLAAIYHFGTKSWTPLYVSLSQQGDGRTGNFSNFITDNNGDILYYHHDSDGLASNINEIKKWNHDAIQDSDFSITTKNFVFQTKDITFDSISSTKNIYTVYITYKVKRDGTDSGVVVKAAVNGSGDFSVIFSDSTSKFQGTTTNCYTGDTLDETDGIWKTAKLKFDNPSLVKGINSIQLHLSGFAAFDFEINDISITYRIIKKN